MKKTKLIVVGLDGGCFALIETWLEQGLLPNIKFMIENGVAADLESCLPPVTSPNWKCYTTGRNPGKLGMFWWENVDVKNIKMSSPLREIGNVDDFWHSLNRSGYRTAIVNTPLTWPPKPVNGYIVAGAPDASDSNYCFPESLEDELKDKFNYRVNTLTSHDDPNNKELHQEILALIESRFKVAAYLLEKDEIDFLQVTTFYLNTLQHYLWKGEPVLRAWKIVDKWVGRFLEKGVNVMIMSDHGCINIDTVFSINKWLVDQGFLYIKGAGRGARPRRLAAGILDYLKILEFIKKSFPGLFARVKKRAVLAMGDQKLKRIDWERSSAFALGQGPIYILEEKGSKKYLRVKQDLKSRLMKVKTPDSNLKVAKDVVSADEIYSGGNMKFAPDLLIDYTPGIHIIGLLGTESVFMKPDKWLADNKRHGIFLACGSDMAKGRSINDISILDLAPSILHLFDASISSDMDGRVRKEIFSGDSEAWQREVKIDFDEIGGGQFQGPEAHDSKAVHDRLQELGYL